MVVKIVDWLTLELGRSRIDLSTNRQQSRCQERKLGSLKHLPHQGNIQVSKRTPSIEAIQGSPTTVLYLIHPISSPSKFDVFVIVYLPNSMSHLYDFEDDGFLLLWIANQRQNALIEESWRGVRAPENRASFRALHFQWDLDYIDDEVYRRETR